MTTGKHTRELAAALVLIAHANARREDAVRTMHEQVNGFGAAGETPGVTGGGHSDPTPALVETKDAARLAMDRERRLRRELVKAADEYARLVYGWAPARLADAQAQQETALDNRRRCEPCAAVGKDAECFRRSDLGGVLGYAMALCGWHYKQVKSTRVYRRSRPSSTTTTVESAWPDRHGPCTPFLLVLASGITLV